MTTYYKAFAADGRTLHTRDPWPLPKGKRPGKWLPPINNIEPCKRGYHVMTADQLCYWPGWSLYEVEVKGDIIEGDEKVVVSQARLLRRVNWNEKKLYLWLSDVAELALSHAKVTDTRSTEAVQALRDLAAGKIDKEKLDTAANAAMSAAYAAAAMSAAYAAYAAASMVAADAAAYAAKAAFYAAYAAAANRKWQTDRMWQYIRDEAV